MSYDLITIKKKQTEGMELKLTIWQDDLNCNPRDWDNLGTMVYGHGRYNLGDRTFDSSLYEGWEEMKRGECGAERDIIALPLYLYDHSGITMNTTGFHCRWDSGQVGWIYVTKEKAREELGVKRITKKVEERILEILKAEVDMFDKYISGEVYGFTLEDDEKGVHDSCGGFLGREDIEYMKEHTSKEYHHLFDEAMESI